MVRPITIVGIFNRFVNEDALSTIRFAPIISGTNPAISNISYHIGLLLICKFNYLITNLLNFNLAFFLQ
jgi:hypothetical protein